ncbi:2-oxoglutarate dehydrogenase E1 component mitochondrial [Mycena chlorophos]|uniref:Protein transport protein SEC23 n=1 Tax=Mycena chlorophos TaxID=658473 RepID=A0A8H6WGI0_MYCCL|nr:2-oxoglutarate dehydrogenase E1 component mitochondrial [Mycena chlorophos]
MGFNTTFDLQPTKELKVPGLIYVEVNAINSRTSTTVYFEVDTPAGQPLHGFRGLVQLVTHYQHSSDFQCLRATTMARNFADSEAGSPSIAASLEQEAAAVLIACIAVYKDEVEDLPDVLRWLDRMLIRRPLMSYTFETPSQPVLLDSGSIKHGVILLLDTFFHILIFHRESVAQWRKQGW